MHPIRTVALTVLAAVLLSGQSREPCKHCRGTRWVTCATCLGQWKSVKRTETCEEKGGAGCDGKGWRKCFICRGEGKLKCANCNGDGQTSKRVRFREGNRFVWRTVREACEKCGRSPIGAGWMDCEKCKPAQVCSACDRVFEGQAQYCPCTPPSTYGHSGKTTLVERVGMIECPRCKGKGVVEKTGKCPECNKGRQPCSACN